MADTLSWPGDRAVLERVATLLRSGKIVGAPTEAGPVGIASALDAGAVKRLIQASDADIPPAILLSSAYEVFDWAPHVRGAAVRLIRDHWPGALVLVTKLGVDYGLFQNLPAEVRESLIRSEGLPMRLSPSDDWSDLFAAAGVPLAAASLRPDSAVDAILGESPTPTSARETVVAVDGRRATVLREGSIASEEIEASRRCRVVFVCTGNTCRSPLAGVLCRRLLADTLGVAVTDLAEHGFEVASAGLAAMEGDPASHEAVEVARELGADLSAHASRPLTMEMVDRADHLFTMTSGHLRMLASLRLPVGPEPQLLSAWGEDVPDPIGGPRELYEACAERIRLCLRERLPQILEG